MYFDIVFEQNEFKCIFVFL